MQALLLPCAIKAGIHSGPHSDQGHQQALTMRGSLLPYFSFGRIIETPPGFPRKVVSSKASFCDRLVNWRYA